MANTPMTYRDRISKLVGDEEGSDYPKYLTEYLKEGLQLIINAIPSDMLWLLEGSEDFVNESSPTTVDSTADNNGALNDSVTSITTSVGEKISVNDIIQFQSKDEQMLVTAVDNLTLTVTRGYYGTTPQSVDDGTNILKVTPQTHDIGTGTNKILYVLRESDNKQVNYTVGGVAQDKELVECREVPSQLQGRVAANAGWYEEATETDPVWFKKGGKVTILPVSTSPNTKVYYVSVPPKAWTDASAPQYVAGLTVGAGVVPKEFDDLLVLFAASRWLDVVVSSDLISEEGGDWALHSQSLETLIEDEDIDLVQAKAILIGELKTQAINYRKQFEIGLRTLLEGTYKQQTQEDIKRRPQYSQVAT
tara:strand:- start:17538 stop:18626 length:1089 start_codon:yes stop_codon:yes gene_type:complete